MTSDPESLVRLALRVEDDPFFFGHWLRLYAGRHSLDDAALSARLGVTLDTLTRLRLCRRPATPADVARVATHYGAEPIVVASASGIRV